MSRDKILSDLFTSKDFTSCISKMNPANLQDELKAEVALILCEMEDEKLIGMANRNELKFYTVRIILNLIQSSTSPFYKKFRSGFTVMNDMATINQDIFSVIGNDLDILESWDGNGDNNVQYKKAKYLKNEFIKMNDDSYDIRKDLAIAEIDNLYWYDREILKLYIQYGTYRKIEEITGIPFESIYKTTQNACKLIRDKVGS